MNRCKSMQNILGAVLAAALLVTPALRADDNKPKTTAKDDIKEAGSAAKTTVVKTGTATAKATGDAAKATGRGAKKVGGAVARGTKKVVNKTGEGLEKTGEAIQSKP